MKEREGQEIAAGVRMRTISIILLFLGIWPVGGDERYSESRLISDRSELELNPVSLQLPRAQALQPVALGCKFDEPLANTPPVTDDDRGSRPLLSGSSKLSSPLRPSGADVSMHRPIERFSSASTIVGQIGFSQLDHGNPGGKPLPSVPTLTHFGLLGGEIFFWTVEGPAGARYRLDTSTDLKNWSGGEAVTTGGPNPPSGFVSVAEVGERFFVRVTSL